MTKEKEIKRIKKQLKQFDDFYQSFTNCNEVKKSVLTGTLSTDKKYTKKVLQQQEVEQDKEENMRLINERKEFMKTCELAGIDPTTSSRMSSPKKNKNKKNKKTNEDKEKVSSNTIDLLLQKKPDLLPWPFDDLLRLQNYDGRWLDVYQVFEVLNIPPSGYFTNGELSGPKPHEWEQATALAVAKMRQRYDLFHELGRAHDRALPWLKTPNIIRFASDIIYFCEKQGYCKQQKKGGDDFSDTRSLEPPVDPYQEMMEASSITIYARVKHQEALKKEKIAATEGIAQKQIDDERRMIAETCLVDKVNFSKMIAKVQDLQRDCEICENKCIEIMTFVDKLRKEIHECLQRCVHNYENCRLHAERNESFLELQACLGDDVPGRVGFPGWQAEGKQGYRTAIIKLLNALYNLANARMVLREVCITGSFINRDVTSRNFEAQEFYFLVKQIQESLPPAAEPADMFYLSWNGKDMMQYVYTSLDFLHKCPLLVKWFGTAYPWYGNPITFCIPFEEICQKLITDKKVEAFLERCEYQAKQSCNYFMSSQAANTGTRPVVDMAKDADYARKDDRRQRDDVLRCQEVLDEAMEQIPSWWPSAFELSDLQYVNQLNIAFLTLRVTTREYAKTNRHTLRGDKDYSADPISKFGEGGAMTDERNKRIQSSTAPGRLSGHTEGEQTTEVAFTSQQLRSGKNTTIPSDFRTWLFYDDWYDDYHSRPDVVAKKKKKQLKKRTSRAYFVRTRPGGTAELPSGGGRPRTGSRRKRASRSMSSTKHSSRPPSPTPLPPQSPIRKDEEKQFEEVGSFQETVPEPMSSSMSLGEVAPTRKGKAKLRTKKRDVHGIDIGGDIFSALDSPSNVTSKGDKLHVGDSSFDIEGSDEHKPTQDTKQGAGKESSGDGKISADVDDDMLLTQQTNEDQEDVEGSMQLDHDLESAFEGSHGGSFHDSRTEKESVDLLIENMNVISTAPSIDATVQEDQLDTEAKMQKASHSRSMHSIDDNASAASIESLSQTVKSQNLMHEEAHFTQSPSGVSAGDILGGMNENKTTAKSSNKKGAKTTTQTRGKTTKQLHQRKASNHSMESDDNVDTKVSSNEKYAKSTIPQNQEDKSPLPAQESKDAKVEEEKQKESEETKEKVASMTEKEKKKRRKATVNERLEAARRGRGNAMGGEQNANEFPVIKKRDTVSRVATSKTKSQQMTRRANNSGLVMPPVSHAKGSR